MKIFLIAIFLLLLPSSLTAQQESPYLNSLYKALSNAKNDTARMEVYNNLGSYYLLENRDSSSYYLEKALPIAVRLNMKLNEAAILNEMGVIQMQQEKFSKSLESYLKAINIAKDPAIEKTIWYLSPGQSRSKVRMLELSNSYDLIGLLNAYTGNWSDNIKNQKKNYREAEKYAKAAGDTVQIATINFHMGIAYMNEGKLDSAFLLITEAISTFSNLKDRSVEGRAMKYLGDTYAKMGKFDLAANTLLQARALLIETNDYVHLGLTYISLNRVYTDLKKIDSAFYYAKEGLKVFENRKDPVGKKDVFNLLASHFDQLGMTDSATVYLKIAKSLSDSLSVEERKNLLEFHDVVVEEQKKLENLEKEKIQTRNRIITYNLIAGLFILSLIGLILNRNNKKEKKAKIVLEKTLKELKSTQTQLIQSEKMASLGQLTAGIAHEIQNPLNFVNNFSEVSAELVEEIQEARIKNQDKIDLETENEILTDLKENLSKITLHGKRADAIVKGMLEHSRTGSGVKELTDINSLAKEYLNLSYQSFISKNKEIEIELITDFDPTLPQLELVRPEIGKVLLNILNNAFYAIALEGHTERSRSATVSLSTKNLGDKIEISVSDNGPGIPDSIKDKIFQPFFTTKPTGQGTGLGLSLSYDIVKAHGGELRVESQEGKGSQFIFQLPIA